MKRNTRKSRGVSARKTTAKRGGFSSGGARKPKMSDPTRGFQKFEERLHGPESMIKDHTPMRYTNRSAVGSAIEKLRQAKPLPPDADTKLKLAWFLVKVVHQIVSMQGKDKTIKLKRYEGKPSLAFSAEGGIRYRTKVELDHGKPNKYMKSANDEFGKVSVTLPILRSTDLNDELARTRAFSLSGANRQGIMTDFLADKDENSIEEYVAGDVYRYYGLPSNGIILDFFLRKAVTSEFRAQLADPNYAKYENMKLYSCINSKYSVHNFYNANMYADINIKVYICRYKDNKYQELDPSSTYEPEIQPIWYDVANFTNTKVDNNYRIPQVGPIYGANDGAVPSMGFNWFGFEDKVTIGLHGAVNDKDEIQSIQRYAELGLALGVTPQQSPMFRKKWDVLDVVDATIGPEDTWELELEERFAKSQDIMEWVSTFQPIKEKADSKNYAKPTKCTDVGDVVLFVTFTGSPSSFYVLKPDDTIDTPVDSIPVEAAPAKLRHTVTHGINVSWPAMLQVLPSPSGQDQGWNAIEEVTNNLNRESYKHAQGQIFVPSSQELSRGGEKTVSFEKGPWPPSN